MPANISADKLQEGLCTKLFAKNIVFLHEVDSTNGYAKELATYGAEEGTVVIAETQTAGRGRLGREWFSPKGGLYFSVILRPEVDTSDSVKLVSTAGLAVAKSLEKAYCLHIEIKRPNDVLVNGKKICGILAETNTVGEKINYAIIGIGINANFKAKDALPKETVETATSLEDELGRKISLEQLFKVLIEKLENLYTSFLEGQL